MCNYFFFLGPATEATGVSAGAASEAGPLVTEVFF